MNKTLSLLLTGSMIFSTTMLTGCDAEDVANDLADIINDNSDNDDTNINAAADGSISFLLTDASDNREHSIAVDINEVTLHNSVEDTSTTVSTAPQTIYLNQANQLQSLIIASEEIPFGSYDAIILNVESITVVSDDNRELELADPEITIALEDALTISEDSPAVSNLSVELYAALEEFISDDSSIDLDPVDGSLSENPLMAFTGIIDDIDISNSILHVCADDSELCYDIQISLSTKVMDHSLEPLNPGDLSVGDSISLVGLKAQTEDNEALVNAHVIHKDLSAFSIQGDIATIEEIGTDGESTINVRMSIDLLCPNWDFDEDGVISVKPLPEPSFVKTGDDAVNDNEENLFVVDTSYNVIILDEQGNECSLECLTEGQAVNIFGVNAEDITPILLEKDLSDEPTDMFSVVIQLEEKDTNSDDDDNTDEPISIVGQFDVDTLDINEQSFILQVEDELHCINFDESTEFFTAFGEEKTPISVNEMVSGFTEVVGIQNEECIDAEFVITEIEDDNSDGSNDDDGNTGDDNGSDNGDDSNNDDDNSDNNDDSDDNNSDDDSNNNDDDDIDGRCDGDSIDRINRRFTLKLPIGDQCVTFTQDTTFTNQLGEEVVEKSGGLPLKDGPVTVKTDGTDEDDCLIAVEIIVK